MPTHYLDTVTRAYSNDGTNWKTAQDGVNIEYNATNVFVTPTQRFSAVNTFIANAFIINPAVDVIYVNTVQKVAGTYTVTTLIQLLQSVFYKANSSYGGTGFLGPMTVTQRDAIASPVIGSYIYNTTYGFQEFYKDSFWGWMPLNEASIEWRRKYGNSFFREFTLNGADDYLQSIGNNGGGNFGNSAISGATSESSNVTAMRLATNANANAGYLSASGATVLGSGQTAMEARIYIPTLSNGTDRFQLGIGFMDNNVSKDQTDAVCAWYDEGGVATGSTASPNWQIITSSNSSRIFQQTSVPVVAASWLVVKVQVNSAGTGADVFVNGTQIGVTATSNIPTGLTRALAYGALPYKSVGTNTRDVDINYLWFLQKFANIR